VEISGNCVFSLVKCLLIKRGDRDGNKSGSCSSKKGPFVLEDLVLSEPAEDQILVRLVATGLCHTDLVCRDQHYPVPLPMVFGHEGAGVVEKVGSAVKKVQPGDHVVLTFYTCGRCDACLSGDPTSCANSFVPNFMGRSVAGECTVHDHDGSEVGASFLGSLLLQRTHYLTNAIL